VACRWKVFENPEDYEYSCWQDKAEDVPSPAEIYHCRTTGAKELCVCDFDPEKCFVACGPIPEEDCPRNENGRCRCPHHRCCGCDVKCEDVAPA